MFCTACGRDIGDANFCASCGTVRSSYERERPTQGAAGVDRENGPPYASFWLRLGGFLVDYFILQIAGILIVLILRPLMPGPYYSSQPSLSETLATLNFVFGELILMTLMRWLYFAIQHSSAHQATIGQRAVGIYVADEAGQPISFGRATGRHFASWLSALILYGGYFMQPFTARKQALHDKISDTVILQGRPL